jgi:hypothetical protein
MTDTSEEILEQPQPSGPKPELFSTEFYAQFGELRDHVTFHILYDIGLTVLDDGSHKMKRPIFKPLVEEALTLYHEDIITLDQMREYIDNLNKGKITRYKLEVEFAKIRKNAKKS